MTTLNEKIIVHLINHESKKGNQDNISRTAYYEKYYLIHPEIKWSLLAALVSRNAGWNMCDLEGRLFSEILEKRYRALLFSTYERANGLIFADAYPQLLVYHYSTILNQPLFHLLKKFHVSTFMIREWERFWQGQDQNRLLYALIINEQNLIQKPIITNTFYQKNVFQTFPFILQDFFHYSIVLFPTRQGELYGASATQFVKLDARIELGKTLASILFHTGLYEQFIDFIKLNKHTGSRYDFEKFLYQNPQIDTPPLRFTYPIIQQEFLNEPAWDTYSKIKHKWFRPPKIKEDIHITDWYKRKRKEIEMFISFYEWKQLK